jgi:aminoglycoside phosphotransferase (APT) family kinase protein
VRALVCLALVLSALAAAVAAAGGAQTNLRITVWPDGRGKDEVHRFTLRCAPAAGTLPNRARACTRLAALTRPFAPVPADVACTEIYGGPAEALVVGTHRGRRIWARFNRTDGCRIERWRRHEFLFGGIRLGPA